ncbi:Cys-tRNA(Pro) deacylase [Nostocoides veronense]|uniref:Cys-tRNA(Pro)/Cys-tRNA(Cys) deacylase n=1 Tax=Nostocoides veronense TaxID=330836 RepID=A0ABN2LER3_9MICO
MPPRHSSGTPATVVLTAAGIAFTEHSYAHDPGAASYGLEAAQALGLPPEQVFKTLLVDLDGGRDKVAVGIVPVDAHLDLKAMAAACGAKRATMADPVVAQRLTGYVVGGISPIAQKRPLPTVLDASASAYEQIYVSGGRRGFDIGLAPSDLLAVTGGRSAAIAR